MRAVLSDITPNVDMLAPQCQKFQPYMNRAGGLMRSLSSIVFKGSKRDIGVAVSKKNSM